MRETERTQGGHGNLDCDMCLIRDIDFDNERMSRPFSYVPLNQGPRLLSVLSVTIGTH